MDGLRRERGALTPCAFDGADLDTWVGAVSGVEDVALPIGLGAYECRNNKLAHLALEDAGLREAVGEAVARFGAHRVGLFVGTSTSGLQSAEHAYRDRDPHTGALPASFHYRETQNGFSVADLARRLLGLKGPAQCVLTACASSAKVFASAYRYMRLGLCDAAVAGGVDSLCLTTLYGFNALELVGAHPCRPWGADRNGISIGEAAGFALLQPLRRARTDLALLGCGESLDAYHMSTPHPHGEGAALAMRRALASAGLEPPAIDYVNLHGTATRANDAAEDAAVVSVLGSKTLCSATKGWFGHALGAAGIAELILSGWCLQEDFVPGTLNTNAPDPALSANLQLAGRTAPLRHVMSNSFGFGGSNCSLVLGQV